MAATEGSASIPATLKSPGAVRFWLAIGLTGVGTGLAAAALTRMLQGIQNWTWGGGVEILAAARAVAPARHIGALLGAALVIIVGQLVLKKLSNANGIDVTAAIWFQAGRLPGVRTVGSALLSIVIVGMGVSLGREGAPKQVGAVLANLLSDKGMLSDEQRKLLVACGAGAGMAAAYGVPLGGALFAVEVLRGMLALRFVLPALFTSTIAAGVAWLFLPDAPVYSLPEFHTTPSVLVWALFMGPIAGLFSVSYVRLLTFAERVRPEGWRRLVIPLLSMGCIGALSIWLPQILGNGRDVSQLAFKGQVGILVLVAMVLLKPVAIFASVGSGAPGGLFTPSLTCGAMLGGVFGWGWSQMWPAPQGGIFAFLGAGAVLAATTQGPISSVVLLMELTGGDRSFILPLLIVVGMATLTARTIEPRSVYDARLNDEQIQARMRQRDQPLPPTG